MAVSAASNEGRILNRPDVNGRAGFNTPFAGPVPWLRNRVATSMITELLHIGTGNEREYLSVLLGEGS